ncbi:hypothetical protein ACGFX4_18950 [Kitasatospora sp. NPDC048365]|uniref:hypothetical protein n=1 Tax=Kitasatospora sp. NPDC048365 TaxID=3364050 RepID=UPI00371F4F59
MTDHQLLAPSPTRAPRAPRQDTALLQLLRGTAPEDRAAQAPAVEPDEEPRPADGPDRRAAAAHCRYAMHYAD